MDYDDVSGSPVASETCSQCLSEELKPENVAPMHENTRLFIDSQWTVGPLSVPYVVYRVVAAVLIVTWIIVDLLNEAGRWYSYSYGIWFVFATNWSVLMLCIVAVAMAASSTFYLCRQRRQQRRHALVYHSDFPSPIGWGLRLQWVLYTMAANSALVVSISYWSFILIFVNNDMSDFITTPMSQLKHSLNTIYMIVDLFVNAIPIRIYHMVYPLLAGLIYAIFNAIYFTNHGRGPDGHPYAYDVMDWRHPLGSTVTCLLGFVLSAIVQFVLYGLYRARLAAHRRLNALIAAETAAAAGPISSSAADIFGGSGGEDAESGPIITNGVERRGGGGGPEKDRSGKTNVGYRSVDSLEMNGR